MELPLCECGCGGRVTKPGNRFIKGHGRCRTPWKPKPEPKLCKCGCGEYAKPGNDYINGHNNRGKPYWEKQQEPKLCKCGCGNYAEPGNDYILGHYSRGKTPSDETRKQQKISQLKRYENPLEREKAKEMAIKRWTDPEYRKKQKVGLNKYWENSKKREKQRQIQIKRFEDPAERERQRDGANKRWENPLEREKASEYATEYWSDITNREKLSATKQGIPYDEWEDFASTQLYCPDFNEECKESNREKYDRRCFLTGLPEKENITLTGKQQHLSVHHVDMDKGQGCDGKRWKLVPICLKWHGRIHNKLWEARIIWLLDNVWNEKLNQKVYIG